MDGSASTTTDGRPSRTGGRRPRRGLFGVLVGAAVLVAAVVVLVVVVLPRTGTPSPADLLAAQRVTDPVLGRVAGHDRVRLTVRVPDGQAARVAVVVSCTGRDVARIHLDGTWVSGVACSTTSGVGEGSVSLGGAVEPGVEHVVEVEAAPGAAIAVTAITPAADQ